MVMWSKWHRPGGHIHYEAVIFSLTLPLRTVGFGTLLQQGISEPIFYGNLVYKLKRIVEKP